MLAGLDLLERGREEERRTICGDGKKPDSREARMLGTQDCAETWGVEKQWEGGEGARLQTVLNFRQRSFILIL